ncbi:MAG: hypothetical protein ACYCSB_06125 [bacterium]
MTYYGIKDKKTGQLLLQFFGKNTKGGTSVVSLKSIADPLYFHIFLTKNKNIAESLLRDGHCKYDNESYKLDGAKDDLEIYESEFNLS